MRPPNEYETGMHYFGHQYSDSTILIWSMLWSSDDQCWLNQHGEEFPPITLDEYTYMGPSDNDDFENFGPSIDEPTS